MQRDPSGAVDLLPGPGPMAKPLARCLFGSGRSIFALCCPEETRSCTSATTRSDAGKPFMIAPAGCWEALRCLYRCFGHRDGLLPEHLGGEWKFKRAPIAPMSLVGPISDQKQEGCRRGYIEA